MKKKVKPMLENIEKNSDLQAEIDDNNAQAEIDTLNERAKSYQAEIDALSERASVLIMRSRLHPEREVVTQEEVASLASDIKHCVSAMMKEPEHDEIKATLNDASAIGLRIQSIG